MNIFFSSGQIPCWITKGPKLNFSMHSREIFPAPSTLEISLVKRERWRRHFFGGNTSVRRRTRYTGMLGAFAEILETRKWALKPIPESGIKVGLDPSRGKNHLWMNSVILRNQLTIHKSGWDLASFLSKCEKGSQFGFSCSKLCFTLQQHIREKCRLVLAAWVYLLGIFRNRLGQTFWAESADNFALFLGRLYVVKH